MSEPVIIENEDESIAIIADQGSPTVVQTAPAESIIVTGAEESYILPIVDGRVVVWTELPVAQVLTSTGGGGSGPSYREIINYDGGQPGSFYGDQISLNGGGVDDPFYYTL